MVIPPKNKRPLFLLTPLRIAAIYVVIGGLWIVFSDRVLSSMTNNPALLTRLQTYKGWGFVAVTAVLLYWMIKRYNFSMRHSEAVLIESEERFRTLAENAHDMIYRMSLPDGRYEYMSPASLAIFGYSAEEFYDSPVLIQKLIHPDWQGYFREQWDNLLSGKMPPSYEYQIIRKSGEVKWLHQRNMLVKDKAGRPMAIEGIVTDITDRKQAEEEREKFVMLADSSSEFIGMCDLDFKPFYVNPAGVRMVGLPDREAACRVKVQDYFFPEDQRFITEEFFPRVLRDGQGDVEIRLRHFQTGKAIWMFYYLFSVRDASGTVVGWATVSRDITERKRAEEEIHKLNIDLEQRVKDRTAELEVKIAEIERMNKLFVGRELRMIELKERIKELEKKVNSER